MRFLAIAALALALSASTAAAGGGYLHMADASRAANAVLPGMTRTYHASAAHLQSCRRRAARSVVCAAKFSGIAAFGLPDWTFRTFIDVRLVRGRALASSRL